jgi:hypothetical protein
MIIQNTGTSEVWGVSINEVGKEVRLFVSQPDEVHDVLALVQESDGSCSYLIQMPGPDSEGKRAWTNAVNYQVLDTRLSWAARVEVHPSAKYRCIVYPENYESFHDFLSEMGVL